MVTNVLAQFDLANNLLVSWNARISVLDRKRTFYGSFQLTKQDPLQADANYYLNNLRHKTSLFTISLSNGAMRRLRLIDSLNLYFQVLTKWTKVQLYACFHVIFIHHATCKNHVNIAVSGWLLSIMYFVYQFVALCYRHLCTTKRSTSWKPSRSSFLQRKMISTARRGG